MQPPIDDDTRFRAADHDDDEAEIRYSLTALGEAVALDRIRQVRFRGFGPCPQPVSLLTLSNRL